MPVIDPQGLFDGDRLAACSDKAKLYWPFLYCASNGHARLEINLTQIRKRCFSVFEKPPSDQEIMDVVEEYTKNYLVLLYEYEGKQWAQFDTAEKYLPKHKSKKDKESPRPAEDALRRFAEGYVTWKKNKSLCLQYMRKISEISESFERLEVSESLEVSEISEKIRNPSEISENLRKTSEISENLRKTSEISEKNEEVVRGIGIGTGIGIGDGIGVGVGNPETTQPIFQNEDEDGQGEEEMKAKKQLPLLCLQLLGVRAETYADVINQIEARAIITSNGQVIREFEEFAEENKHEDFHGKPLSAFLRSLDNPRAAEAKQAVDHPVVKAVGKEIAYSTGNLIALDTKHKAILKVAVEEENYTFEEVMAAFKEFFQNLDTTDQRKINYAALNFVNESSDRLYAIRRKKAEKQAEAEAVARTVTDMVAKAEEDRIARQKARDAEDSLVEDTLGD